MLHMVETADGQRPPQATSSQASATAVSSMSVKQEMLDEAIPAATIDGGFPVHKVSFVSAVIICFSWPIVELLFGHRLLKSVLQRN